MHDLDFRPSRFDFMPRVISLLAVASGLALSCFAVVACGGSHGGQGGATDPNRDSGQGKPIDAPGRNPQGKPEAMTLESHRLGETVIIATGAPELVLPQELARARCEAIFQLAFPETASALTANPFREAKGKASWSEVLAKSSGVEGARPTGVRTLSAQVRIDKMPKTTLTCAFPALARAETAEVRAYAPKGAAYGLDERGDVYGGFQTQVLGGLRWQRRLQRSPESRDSISLQWLLLPVARASEHGFFKLETESLFTRAVDAGKCVARAFQIAADDGFERASLWGIAKPPECSPERHLFELVDKAPSGDAPVARLANGRVDPWSVMAYDDRAVLRPDAMLPFDPTGARTFSCETPFEIAQCGQAVARDMASVLETSVAKGLPLYVRFASKTAANQTLIATGSISPEGNVTILEARLATSSDAVTRVLP